MVFNKPGGLLNKRLHTLNKGQKQALWGKQPCLLKIHYPGLNGFFRAAHKEQF